MSGADIRRDMVKAVDEVAIKLAHIRGYSKVDAAKAVASSFAANLADSRGTTMEEYWRAMLDVADQQVGSVLGEGSA